MNTALQATFVKLLLDNYKSELLNILTNPDDSLNYSLIIDFILLFEKDSELGNGLLLNPKEYLYGFDEATISAQKKLLENLEKSNVQYKIKSKITVRVEGLPSCDETTFPSNNDINNLVKINGTLIKVGSPKLLEYQRDYKCQKCFEVTTVKADYEKYYIITAPTKCPLCFSQNIKSNKEVNVINFKDYQEIKVQEHFGKSKIGNVPKTMVVTLEGDLVDSCKPGDDVAITGILMRRWRPLKENTQFDIEMALKANHLEVCNESKFSETNNEVKDKFCKFWAQYNHQELNGRNHILKSFCPQIYGLYLAKLAIATVLAGGVQKTDENGCSARGTSHLLLVGDAGTGKSQLLRYASKISPRSVFTTGIGSTTAGLTVTAVREGKDWSLEAGALVLADGGVCCIDDFNTIREQDRTSIHEAMEQQSISVAKAGMVTKLQTRCSIFASTSPKGKFDSAIPTSVNVAISSPLLSRFDIVLILLDSKNSDWDTSMCEFILKENINSNFSDDSFVQSNKSLVDSIWSMTDLQNYFSVIKEINPLMTPEAGIILRDYYQMQRSADSRNAARTTVRLLESLIRLSQGHARLMFRNKVTILDAVTAITLIESSMQNSIFKFEVDALHSVVPQNPQLEYKSQLEIILSRLKLCAILEEELKKIKKEEMILEKGQIAEDKNKSLELSSKTTNAMASTIEINKPENSLCEPKVHREDEILKEWAEDFFEEFLKNESDDSVLKDQNFNGEKTENKNLELSLKLTETIGEFKPLINSSQLPISSQSKNSNKIKLSCEAKENSPKKIKLDSERKLLNASASSIYSSSFETHKNFKKIKERFHDDSEIFDIIDDSFLNLKEKTSEEINEKKKQTETPVKNKLNFLKETEKNVKHDLDLKFKNFKKLKTIFNVEKDDWNCLDF